MRSDNAREYLSTQFQEFMAKQGILHQITCPHTPQQNGVAERKNRHLIETARTLLIDMNFSLRFWGDATLSTCYLINRMPSSMLHDKIRHTTMLFADDPVYSVSPHVFLCTCFVHDLTPGKDKHTTKALKCLFLGYSRLQKGYRCYSPNLGRYLDFAGHLFQETTLLHFIFQCFSHRAWFGRFSTVVQAFGMTRSEADHSNFLPMLFS